MELRRELLATVGVLVVLNVSLAFGAVGLFARMGPAIDQILQDNMYSIEAAEAMLGELAEAGGAPLRGEGRERLLDALANAKRNVTEDAERPAIAAIERELPRATGGDPAARHRIVMAVRDLIHINRMAMQARDVEARRLGSAGAWTAVFVGFLSFLLSVAAAVRLQTRFVRPLLDLYDVLEGVRMGTAPLRRCRAADAPREVAQVGLSVNRLLDERLKHEQ